MRELVGQLALVLCITAGAICVILHLATFFTIIRPIWLLLPFALILIVVAWSKAAPQLPLVYPPEWSRPLVLGVFLYAIVSFVSFYQRTGGAASVGVRNGQYVAMRQDRVIRTITEQEYREFPNLLARMMSAWMLMMVALVLVSLTSVW